MKTISPIELQNLLIARPDLPLFDVRTPVEFSEVHVPQARNVPLDELRPGTLPLRKDEPVYLLCRTDNRSALAAEKFAKEGFVQPIILQGGTQAWIAGNFPVVRGTAKVISLERQVRIVAGSLVLIGALLGWFVHRGFFGLSAFVGAGLVFAGLTDFCGMGLLLAKMPWNKKVSP
jgi:rhodanese-related sulfurtransferase